MEFVVLRGGKEKREKMVSLDSRVTWVSRVTGVRLVCWDHEEKMGQRDQKVGLALAERLDPWVWPEKRVNSEFLVYLGTQEDKDQRVPLASPDFQEPTGRKEGGVWQAKLVQEDKEVQRVHVVVEVQEVPLENQAPRALLVMMDQQAAQEKEDLKDPRALSASQDQRGPLDHPEKTGCLVTQDNEERLVSKAKLDHQALEEWWDHRVLLERRVPLGREVTQAPLVHLVSRVYLVLLGRREQRVIQVLRDQLGKMGHQV